jgi:hypothetical protein
MQVIMKEAVNRVYRLLRLKETDAQDYARQIAYGAVRGVLG